MSPKGIWEIRDPAGFKHVVDGDAGWENVTHTYDPMQRPFVLSHLIYEIEKTPDQGEWDGFAWIKL